MAAPLAHPACHTFLAPTHEGIGGHSPEEGSRRHSPGQRSTVLSGCSMEPLRAPIQREEPPWTIFCLCSLVVQAQADSFFRSFHTQRSAWQLGPLSVTFAPGQSLAGLLRGQWHPASHICPFGVSDNHHLQFLQPLIIPCKSSGQVRTRVKMKSKLIFDGSH